MRRLPDPLPDDPLPLAGLWLADAGRNGAQRNPDAMALATADRRGAPSVRMVLLKSLSQGSGYAVFYTSRESRKGAELDANPRAAGVLYWEKLGRQLRLEGRVTRSPDAESDAYFATRPIESRVSAWASAQSQPLAEFAMLEQRAAEKSRELVAAAPIPRPPYWGGYRLWLDAIEFWIEGVHRLHERVRYERELAPAAGPDTGLRAGAWRHALLQP